MSLFKVFVAFKTTTTKDKLNRFLFLRKKIFLERGSNSLVPPIVLLITL